MKTKNQVFSSVISFLIFTLSWVSVSNATPISEGDIGASVYGDARINYSSSSLGTKVDTVDVSNPSGSVSHNYPPPTATTTTPWPSPYMSGYADPGAISQGTLAFTNSSNTKSAIESRIGNSFIVDAGTSGLSYGDATTLTFQFHLDGATQANTAIGTDNNAIATTSSVFRIWDKSQEQVDYTPYLLDFSAYIWDQEYTASNNNHIHNHQMNWYARDYLHEYPVDPLYADSVNASYNPDTSTCLPTPSNPNCENLFDTGLLTFSFDTTVGAELYMYGWMQSISQVSGSGYAYNNFLNTMGGSFTAANGIVLDYAIQPQISGDTGSNPVPEPASLALLGIGLVGLGVSRKRKHNT